MDKEMLNEYLRKIDDVFQSLLRRLHHELDKNLVKGITGSQFFVMKKIHSRGRSTVSEVADDLCVSLSAITSMVDKLCRSGLVIRLRDEKDRRQVWLELTSRGIDILEICLAGRRRVVEKYVGQLPDEDITKLVSIYEKLLVIIQAEEAGEM